MRPHKHIRAIWDRYNNSSQISDVTIDEVKTFAEARGLVVKNIAEIKFGWNSEIEAILIKTNEGSALYPRQKLNENNLYKQNIIQIQNYEKFWQSVDWFMPLFIARGKIDDAIHAMGIDLNEYRNWNKRLLQERFEHCLTSIYTLDNIIPVTVQTLSGSRAISKHLPIIKESILAFYSGMKVVAIAALIPIIENILNSIINVSSTDLDLINKVNKCIDLAQKKVIKIHIENVDWIPPEYIKLEVLKVMNERVFVLESIRYWLINSFYSKTDNYDNHSGFNRHFFAHAKSDIWQNTSNFFRAIGLIQALAFVECFALEGSGVSIFPPTPDERSNSFKLEISACEICQYFKNNFLQQLQVANCLPFNDIASDDGWHRRAALLSKEMNDQIISSLRNKGWQCHSFGDPVKLGAYITVNASKEDREIKVALLYTCATGNKIYKELDKFCDFILYLGPHSHQESYAFGVQAKVLPVKAWIPPD